MWEKIKAWFKHSETILLARVQMVAGTVLMILVSLVQDPNVSSAIQGILQPKYIPFYIIAVGIVTEVLRRRGATDLK